MQDVFLNLFEVFDHQSRVALELLQLLFILCLNVPSDIVAVLVLRELSHLPHFLVTQGWEVLSESVCVIKEAEVHYIMIIAMLLLKVHFQNELQSLFKLVSNVDEYFKNGASDEVVVLADLY